MPTEEKVPTNIETRFNEAISGIVEAKADDPEGSAFVINIGIAARACAAIHESELSSHKEAVRELTEENERLKWQLNARWMPGEKVENIATGAAGIIYALYAHGISVKYKDGCFEVFHYSPKYHKQTPIESLSKRTTHETTK